MQLDHQTLEQAQAQRLRRARRTAKTIGIVAFAVFVFSIAQMLWCNIIRKCARTPPPPIHSCSSTPFPGTRS